MQLCTFSKSAVHANAILESCPMSLPAKVAKSCPCRQRIYVDDLRLLSCTFPNTWRGERIRNAEALSANLKTQYETRKRDRRNERKIDMSATTIDVTAGKTGANGVAVNGAPTNGASNAKPANGTALSTRLVSADQMAISLYQRIADPMDAINKLGMMFAESCMFGCNNANQGRVLAMTCLAEGKPPSYYARRFHIIGGNMSMKADAMLGEFRLAGGKHRIIERSPDKCAIELIHDGQKFVSEFTWEDASEEEYPYTTPANKGNIPKKNKDGSINKAALKDNWSTPRKRMQMLWARVVSDGIRAMMPEVNFGQYTPEELSGNAYAEPQEVESDVVDAEYEVAVAAHAGEVIDVADGSAAAATAANGSGPTTAKRSRSSKAKEAASEAASEAKTATAADVSIDTTANAAGGVTEAPFDTSAGSGGMTTQLQTDPNPAKEADEKVDNERLIRMKELKTALGWGDAQWKPVLDNFGVPTAKNFTKAEADRVLMWMEKKLKEREQRDELSKWADGVAGKN